MINYNEDELASIYATLNDIIKKMISYMNEAKKHVSNLDNKEHWDGNGFNNFNQKFKDIVDNFVADANEIYKLNNNITTVISRYASINAEVMKTITHTTNGHTFGGTGGSF